MKSLVGKKIELTPNTPKENQIVCGICGGTGWLLNDKETSIVKCNKCNNGLIDICEYCKKPFDYYYSRTCNCNEAVNARKIKREETITNKERELFNQAKIKVNISLADKSKIEMLYSEMYPYNEGYFTEIEELIDWCKDNGVEIPKYVWGTYKTKISIDGDSIVEDACCDLHEDAFSNITGLDELQEFLDEWCSKQTGTDTYYVDYGYAILI